MTSQKYAYADHSALLYTSRYWKAVENTLSQDITTLSAHSSDLEAEAQQYQNGDGGISS